MKKLLLLALIPFGIESAQATSTKTTQKELEEKIIKLNQELGKVIKQYIKTFSSEDDIPSNATVINLINSADKLAYPYAMYAIDLYNENNTPTVSKGPLLEQLSKKVTNKSFIDMVNLHKKTKANQTTATTN